VVFGSPQFSPGEDVILYLDTWPDGSLRVHEMFLGKFSVVKDPSTGQRMAVRDTPGPNVEVLSDPSNPPVSPTSRMELSAYIQEGGARRAAKWAWSGEFGGKNHKGVPQLAAPPEYEPKAATGGIEAQYHLWNPAVRHFEPDNGQPVVF